MGTIRFLYTLDGEDCSTPAQFLTAKQILGGAGLDVSQYRLEEIINGKSVLLQSQDDYLQVAGRNFISVYIGGTPNA